MASVMIYEKLEPAEEVVIRLTTDEAQELFDALGDSDKSTSVYEGLANEGFEHTSQEDA